ncbi:MAG TPA: hypothetical protein VHV77_03230 [Pirellulales bacterium]|nr:hypothetical protein [Pirellulales bacterium]
MTEDLAGQLIPACLLAMRERLEKALARARAAEACLGGDTLDIALQVALDVEVLTYEANVLLNAASLIHRMAGEAGRQA